MTEAGVWKPSIHDEEFINDGPDTIRRQSFQAFIKRLEWSQTRKNVKLWNRADASEKQNASTRSERYGNVMARSNMLLIDKLADVLEGGNQGFCKKVCLQR
jgi:hypothetical protein